MSKLPGINGEVFDCDPRLKRLHEYVEQNYSESIPLEKAARIAALGKSYFSSYFRAKVGITFTDWLRQVRVEKAVELMKGSDFSISEVAEAVGLKDLKTFERAFKKVCAEDTQRVQKIGSSRLTEQLCANRKSPYCVRQNEGAR